MSAGQFITAADGATAEEAFAAARARGFKSVRLLRPEDLAAAHFRWFVEQPGLMMSAVAELGGLPG